MKTASLIRESIVKKIGGNDTHDIQLRVTLYILMRFGIDGFVLWAYLAWSMIWEWEILYLAFTK